MNASIQNHRVPDSLLFRYCGRAGGVIAVACWLPVVALEAVRQGPPVLGNYYQAIPLVMIFGSYFIGWQKEMLGGLLTIAGTATFVAQYVTIFRLFPAAGAIWFAAPGMSYLIADYLDGRERNQISSRP